MELFMFVFFNRKFKGYKASRMQLIKYITEINFILNVNKNSL